MVFKAYYGDGARHEILHAAGAHNARTIIVCVNDKKAATRIVESTRNYCPQVKLLVRPLTANTRWSWSSTMPTT